MAEGLQYRGSLQLISGGYSPDSCPGCDWEIWGPAPGETPWIDTTGDSGSNTTTYYYRDSIQGKNANSTQVNVTVTDTWSATRLDDNSYRITVTTTIDSFNRVKYGSPDPLGAKIFIRQEKDGPLKWSSGSSCINAAIDATYQSPINIGSRTFTLAPGQSTQDLGTMYYRSNICGHDGDTPPSQWVDEYSMGIKFKNNLPPDYRPGQILDNNKIWQSHNRSGGADNIYTGSDWRTMRTENGAVGTDNPPYMRHTSEWKNQRKIGANK